MKNVASSVALSLLIALVTPTIVSAAENPPVSCEPSLGALSEDLSAGWVAEYSQGSIRVTIANTSDAPYGCWADYTAWANGATNKNDGQSSESGMLKFFEIPVRGKIADTVVMVSVSKRIGGPLGVLDPKLKQKRMNFSEYSSWIYVPLIEGGKSTTSLATAKKLAAKVLPQAQKTFAQHMFMDCKGMRAVYPKGITKFRNKAGAYYSPKGYSVNSATLDPDRDGVACEK